MGMRKHLMLSRRQFSCAWATSAAVLRDSADRSEESGMRRSLMSIQREVSIDPEDVRLYAHVEPWDPGPC